MKKYAWPIVILLLFTLGDQTKRFTITADRKRRGGMTFEIGGQTYAYSLSGGKVEKMR